MSHTISRGTPIVDDSPQGLKERGGAVDLIDNHQLARLGTQECVCILEPPSISWPLEIKVHRPSLASRGNLPGQSRFADLPRAEENDPRHLPQALFNDGAEAT